MAALASTKLDMCRTPQQTAEMNPSHYDSNLISGELTLHYPAAESPQRVVGGGEESDLAVQVGAVQPLHLQDLSKLREVLPPENDLHDVPLLDTTQLLRRRPLRREQE